MTAPIRHRIELDAMGELHVKFPLDKLLDFAFPLSCLSNFVTVGKEFSLIRAGTEVAELERWYSMSKKATTFPPTLRQRDYLFIIWRDGIYYRYGSRACDRLIVECLDR